MEIAPSVCSGVRRNAPAPRACNVRRGEIARIEIETTGLVGPVLATIGRGAGGRSKDLPRSATEEWLRAFQAAGNRQLIETRRCKTGTVYATKLDRPGETQDARDRFRIQHVRGRPE